MISSDLSAKSTVEEIRQRFDIDVERFSKLETGQQASIDAPLVLDLVASCAKGHLKPGDKLLDLGCGAGNFTLRVLQEVHPLNCHLIDLSEPMLKCAAERLHAVGNDTVTIHADDFRNLDFPENSFQIIVAGAVLHHLREDKDWLESFAKLHRWLEPGGILYVSDLITFDDPVVNQIMWNRYGDYLCSLKDEAYRDHVFAYIDKEDSPRSLKFQIDVLRESGFRIFDILHSNSVFACYRAQK